MRLRWNLRKGRWLHMRSLPVNFFDDHFFAIGIFLLSDDFNEAFVLSQSWDTLRATQVSNDWR